MLTRRDLLQTLAAMGVGGAGFAGYAMAEAALTHVTKYRLTPPGWTPGLSVRLAVIADLHICDPWMSLARVEQIVAQTNRLGADAILLLGDYVAGPRLLRFSKIVPPKEWANLLGGLKAPLGVYAVLGNHDWWDDVEAFERRAGPTRTGMALEAAGVPVFENQVVRLEKNGLPFWIAGLGSQWAFHERFRVSGHLLENWDNYVGVDDVPGTLAQIADDAPVVLMAHEPDIFSELPARVSLTIAGHTHGGQVRVLGYSPRVPSRFGDRYVYGHKIEDGRHMIVSGGLGCSGLPIRIGAPPEIVVIELGSETTA